MKGLFNTPSWQAGRVRLADYAELLALKSPRGRASLGDLIASFDRKEEEDEDRFERPSEEAFEEMADRTAHLGASKSLYPFELRQNEIRVLTDALHDDEGWLYLYLLLATALNMRDDRKHLGIDGADLFEELAAEVGARYFGSTSDPRVRKRVFGTSRIKWPADEDADGADETEFAKAVNALCAEMGEGAGYRAKTKKKLRPRDDKLDVVIWREFSDRRASKLISFGQCKTGTHWGPELPRLNPGAFCNRWFHNPLTSPAIKTFFLADRVSGDLTHEAFEAGILFDRCRILDYAQDLPKPLTKNCATWSRAVLVSQGVHL